MKLAEVGHEISYLGHQKAGRLDGHDSRNDERGGHAYPVERLGNGVFGRMMMIM